MPNDSGPTNYQERLKEIKEKKAQEQKKEEKQEKPKEKKQLFYNFNSTTGKKANQTDATLAEYFLVSSVLFPWFLGLFIIQPLFFIVSKSTLYPFIMTLFVIFGTVIFFNPAYFIGWLTNKNVVSINHIQKNIIDHSLRYFIFGILYSGLMLYVYLVAPRFMDITQEQSYSIFQWFLIMGSVVIVADFIAYLVIKFIHNKTNQLIKEQEETVNGHFFSENTNKIKKV